METVAAAVVALLAAVGAAVVSFFGIRRRTSGRIATTETKTLWDELTEELAIVREDLREAREEMRAMRELYATETRELRESERQCQLELAKMKADVSALRREMERYMNGE